MTGKMVPREAPDADDADVPMSRPVGGPDNSFRLDREWPPTVWGHRELRVIRAAVQWMDDQWGRDAERELAFTRAMWNELPYMGKDML